MVKNIEKILLKTGVNPKNINLEITESFAINDMNRVLEIIKGLKKLGPRIALDDFGTGYSSLNYIKQLPLDLIKVDKTFIDDILEDEYAQAFVRLIVELSKTIGTKLVVEGVEYQEQYELLRGLGVHYIQGFYFGKPAAAKILPIQSVFFGKLQRTIISPLLFEIGSQKSHPVFFRRHISELVEPIGVFIRA